MERHLKKVTQVPDLFPTTHTSSHLPGNFAPSVFHTNAWYQQKEKEAELLVAKQINRWQEEKTNQTAESHPSTAWVPRSLVGKKLMRHFAHVTNSCLRKNELPQWPNSAPSHKETHYVAQRNNSLIDKTLPKLLQAGWRIKRQQKVTWVTALLHARTELPPVIHWDQIILNHRNVKYKWPRTIKIKPDVRKT